MSHRHGHAGFDDDRHVRRLEAEARLAARLHEAAVRRCAQRLADDGVPVHRVLDLGCGPGVASVLLAERFGPAEVVAADGAPRMLARAAELAAQAGVGDRVAVRQLDLDGDLGGLGRAELVWAAMVLHHAADEGATLRAMAGLLAPGGVLCVLEHAEPTKVRLESDLGRPGLWDRLDAAWAGRVTLHPDPRLALEAAGLEVLAAWTARDTAAAPDDDATRAFVGSHLGATARALDGVADPADLAALGRVPPGAVAHVTLSRTVLLARRGTLGP